MNLVRTMIFPVALVLLIALFAQRCGAERSVTFVGGRVSVLTSRVIRLELGTVFEDHPTITFEQRNTAPLVPFNYSLTPHSLKVWTGRVMLHLSLPLAADTLGCSALNVTLENGDVVCPGTARGRPQVDPAHHPGSTPMDSWTDLVLGEAQNLNGSLDTLDCYCGADCCYDVLQTRVQLGLLSRAGWSVVDDSSTAVWTNGTAGGDGWRWRRPRPPGSAKDLYFFLHGHDYRGALRDFVSLAGPTPLKPFRAHGVWWSREYPFSDATVRNLVEEFDDRGLPLNMLVLDYNWHPGPPSPGVPVEPPVEGCNQPSYSGDQECIQGFGGYRWDTALFPDPQRFQRWLHSTNETGDGGPDLQLVLNIHDQCGIDSCQFGYAAAAAAAGIDPASTDPVLCNFLDETYSRSLTAGVLEKDPDHNLTDFWWNDYGLGGGGAGKWQIICTPSNGTAASSANSDQGHCMHCFADDVDAKPQLWSSYVHASRREMAGLRSLTLGIYGGLGNHRYPGVGSGDVYEAWSTLSFEIQLSLTAANVVVEWNHDLGGFMPPPGAPAGAFDPHLGRATWLHDPERYARWLQAGVFQPIFRTHISAPGDSSIWVYPNYPVLKQAYLLRNALVPYIYSAAHASFHSGVLAVRPLYYDWPEEEEAYTLSKLRGPELPLEHSFGDSFVVSPITVASSQPDGSVDWPMWVPPGTWVEYFGGRAHSGPSTFRRNYTQSEIPLLAKAASVVPMKGIEDSKRVAPRILVLAVHWAAPPVGETFRGSAQIYEDDGETLRYKQDGKAGEEGKTWSRITTVDSIIRQGRSSLSVRGGANVPGLPRLRRFEIRFRGSMHSIAAVEGSTSCQSTDVTLASSMAAVVWRHETDSLSGVEVLVATTPIMRADASFVCAFSSAAV